MNLGLRRVSRGKTLKDTWTRKEDGQDSNTLSNAKVLGSIQQRCFDSYLTKQLQAYLQTLKDTALRPCAEPLGKRRGGSYSS